MEKQRVIGNVNLLDLRKVTRESLGDIRQVGNANVVLYTRETAPLVKEIEFGNANAMVEVASGAEVEFVTGQIHITRDRFKSATTPQHLVVVGQAFIHPDVSADDLRRGIASLTVVGQLVCPDPLSGAVRGGEGCIVGQTVVYPPLRQVEFGSLVLDKSRLDTLPDRGELAVIGTLRVTDDVPADLLRRKFEKLYVSSAVLCYPQHGRPLSEILLPGAGKITVIPEGHRFVDAAIELSRSMLETLPETRLYCTERVIIPSDVDAALLGRTIKHLVAKEPVLYPKGLAASVARICDVLEAEAVPYEGLLWTVDDTQRLRRPRLDLLKEKLTLYVTGVLTVDPDVSPQDLLAHLARVHNRGVIRCTTAQAAAIEERLGIREGVLDDAPETGEDSETWLGNVNRLTL